MKNPSPGYDPGLQVDSDEVLPLHRNENLFVDRRWTVDTARELIEAASVAAYPDATCRPLREALAEFHGVTPDNVYVGNGSDEVLADLLQWLRRTYDTLWTCDVSFKVYPMLAERMQFQERVLPGDTFRTGHVSAGADFRGLAVVDSPNSITGSSVPHDELLALAEHPESYLIWDNAYGEYAGDTPPEVRPNLAFVRSFSKFYALASLRVGYCIAHADVIGEMMTRKDAFNVNGLAQAMALEALRRHDEFAALLGDMQESRARLVAFLEGLGFEVHPAHGIALLVRHPRFQGKQLQDELLRRRVAVRHFPEAVTAACVRMTVPRASDLPRLEQALAEIVTP